MKLFKVETTLKPYHVVAKEEWNARDKVMEALGNEVRGPQTHAIINIQEVASTVTGQSKSTLVL